MNVSAWVLVAATAAGAIALLGSPGWLVLAARLPAAKPPDPRILAVRVLPATSVAAAFVALVVGEAPAFVLVLTVGLVVVWAGRRWLAARCEREEAAGRLWVREVTETLAAEIRSGVLPDTCLARMALEYPELVEVAKMHRRGGDVAAAWRDVAERPGAGELEKVARAWVVSTVSGAPLARTLTRVADDLRTGEQVRQEVDGAVAPARSTALVMAVLPFLTLSSGHALGGSPIDTITRTLPGSLVVGAGTALAIGGLVWVDVIVRKAREGP